MLKMNIILWKYWVTRFDMYY